MDFTDVPTVQLVVIANGLATLIDMGEGEDALLRRADVLLDEILLLIIGRSHNGDLVARRYIEGEHRKAGRDA